MPRFTVKRTKLHGVNYLAITDTETRELWKNYQSSGPGPATARVECARLNHLVESVRESERLRGLYGDSPATLLAEIGRDENDRELDEDSWGDCLYADLPAAAGIDPDYNLPDNERDGYEDAIAEAPNWARAIYLCRLLFSRSQKGMTS
jgi:hypothetical protein